MTGGAAQVQRSYEFITNLAFGVTTLHNPSLDTVSGFADAELVRSGERRAPSPTSNERAPAMLATLTSTIRWTWWPTH